MAGRSDYRLIDLRGERDYSAYHIPTAENVTLTALPESALLANEKIVLYSDGGIHASQAWMLLALSTLLENSEPAADRPASAQK